MPGAVTVNGPKGSHALIRQGADPITSPDDILDAYYIKRDSRTAATGGTSSLEEILILKASAETSAAADVDKSAAMDTLEPRIVDRALSFFITRGMVRETGAGYTI